MTMKSFTKFVFCPFCWVFFPVIIFFSCNNIERVDRTEDNVRFDSAYHYVVNNMLMSHEKMDTLLSLCDELTSISPSELSERQLRLWAYSFALSSSVYINNNELKKGLMCLQRGTFIADSLGDIPCANRIANMQALVYSNWRLNDEANVLFDMIIEKTDRNDILSMASAYLSKAIHMIYTEKFDSAAYYMNEIDKLGIKEEDMLPGSYKSVDYTMRLYKGWYLTETPDSLSRAIDLLQGLYDEYHPSKDKTVAFESVCFRLGRAYDLAGRKDKAMLYYNEAKDMILVRPVSFQMFETAEPLMQVFLKEKNMNFAMQLLPVWKNISEQYFDYQLRGMLAYYSIKLDVAGKENQITEAERQLTVRRMENLLLSVIVAVLIIFIICGIIYWYNKKKQLRILFETITRRFIEWREMNLYLMEKQKLQISSFDGNTLNETDEDLGKDNLNGEETQKDVFYRNLYYRVMVVMEKEQPFLNPDLNISSLAKVVITNRTHLSIAINRMTGNNFNKWLAEYRVNYVIYLMNDENVNNIDTLYNQAGFSSRTSFYRQFKQVTGLTPKQYLKQKQYSM